MSDAPLTPLERLGLTLGQHAERMVQAVIVVGKDGQPEVVTISDLGKAQRLKKEQSNHLDLTSG